jgi:hypothetical protein
MRFYLLAASLLALVSFAPGARGQQPEASQKNLAEVGRRLSNPLSDVWALFARFSLNSSDGNATSTDPRVGGAMLFQPILPVPLYGNGEHKWNLITRPTIPVLFSEPIPTSSSSFAHKGGLGDIELPFVIAPPTGKLILGVGPAFLFPTSTDDAFGRSQWGMGPAAVLGYRTEKAIFGAFGQYYFGTGWHGDRELGEQDASYMNLLYFASLDLADAWQVGFSPTITYDRRADSGNRWNVPVGLMVSKTTRVGMLPMKFSIGGEYSVVSQDAYGERAKLVLEVTPVIPALIRRPILGGRD